MDRRKLLFLGLSTLGIVVAKAGDEPADTPNPADQRTLKTLLEAHNKERAKEKLPPLKANAQLETAAMEHARDMAQKEKMSHDGSDGSTPAERVKKAGYRYVRMGENVAVEYPDVERAVRGWMESPPHKKNILGDFTEMGGAIARDFDGRPYWCVEFGTPVPPKPDLTPERAATELVEALNAERKKSSKPLLKRNRLLAEAAQRHATTLAGLDKVVAKDEDGLSALDRVEKAGYRYRRLAEEIASGLDLPEEVVKAWLDRPTDRDNVLGDFADIGVGYAVAKSERAYWCVILGRPLR
ncbi:MAG: CAP domain-containing protein [Isosphaeraceae bacterium]|nr:CAP domain-containing protein [Isosphaeraceae bacterium]